MTPSCALVHTHTSLEACDLCPPSDPKVHEILAGGWGFYSQVHDFRDDHEIVTFAFQPWLKNFSPRTFVTRYGEMGWSFAPAPHLSSPVSPGWARGPRWGTGPGGGHKRWWCS